MTIERSLPAYRFRCSPAEGTFGYFPSGAGRPAVPLAGIRINGRVEGRPFGIHLDHWEPEAFEPPQDVTYLGQSDCFAFQARIGEWGQAQIQFILPAEHPLLLWRIGLSNTSTSPLILEQIDLLRPLRSGKPSLDLSDLADVAFYASGWQSWSYSAAYPAKRSMPGTKLGFLQRPMVYNPTTPDLRQPGYFTADMFGAVIDRRQRAGLLTGFVSQRQQFGTVEAVLYDRPSLRLWASADGAVLAPGARMRTDWAVLQRVDFDDPDPLAPYLEAVAGYHGVKKIKDSPTGWCSWYRYYTNVTDSDIRANVKKLTAPGKRLPLHLVQIDDGWQARVGDWLEFGRGFPRGVAPLAREIHTGGKTAGLWLAPFIVHPTSRLARQHPDWLLRDRRGRPARAGFVWNSLPYGLDLTNPAVLDYVREVIRTAVQEWGFDYLKLDFLYAAALPGRYSDPTHTRAQVLQQGMHAVREAAGADTMLLGCGLPLGSGLGWVDAMRVSADVGESWTPSFNRISRPFRSEVHMPSARNAVHNSITRAFLHRRWWVNDPDCLLVRPETRLTRAEVETLAAVIALTGGSVIVSDDLANLPDDRIRIIETLLPIIGQRARVIDLFDRQEPQLIRLDLDGPAGSWHVLARFNWDDRPLQWAFRPEDFQLPGSSWLLNRFWDRHGPHEHSKSLPSMNIEPHGCAVLAARPVDTDCLYAGSDLHVSQGLEVANWEEMPGQLKFRLALPRLAAGRFWLRLPAEPIEAQQEKNELAWTSNGSGLYEFNTRFDGAADFHIRW